MAAASRPDDGRPDPDALLAAFRRETAGRLKVFLGAAPGVGKTYAMLQNARRLKDEGVDVVVGLVETHGRAETSALVHGLESCRGARSSTTAAKSRNSISMRRWRASPS
jgi:two-component system sensor histidine kinase KdpD